VPSLNSELARRTTLRATGGKEAQQLPLPNDLAIMHSEPGTRGLTVPRAGRIDACGLLTSESFMVEGACHRHRDQAQVHGLEGVNDGQGQREIFE
jgi:hypothetical protein